MVWRSCRATSRAPDVILYGLVLLARWQRLRMDCASAKNGPIVYGIEVWAPPPRWRRLIVGRCVDRVFAISEFTALRMKQAYGLPAERFAILHMASGSALWANATGRPRRGSKVTYRLLTVLD